VWVDAAPQATAVTARCVDTEQALPVVGEVSYYKLGSRALNSELTNMESRRLVALLQMKANSLADRTVGKPAVQQLITKGETATQWRLVRSNN
jgi:hypothetical protein